MRLSLMLRVTPPAAQGSRAPLLWWDKMKAKIRYVIIPRYLSLAEINWKEFPLRVLRFNGGVVNTEVKRLHIR